MKKKGIGLDVTPPKQTCSDKKCPFHGIPRVRGRVFLGTVTSDKMARTVTVVWVRRAYVPKYERYEKRKSKAKAHNPTCINAKKGDIVLIAETKPLSKTKTFAVVKIIGKKTKKESLKDEAVLEAEIADKQKTKGADKKEMSKEASKDTNVIKEAKEEKK